MKKLILGVMVLASLSSFATCKDFSIAKKECLQTIMDNNAAVKWDTVRMGIAITARGEKVVTECLYSLDTLVQTPDGRTIQVSHVGMSSYDSNTCNQLGGKQMTAGKIGF